MRGQLKWGFIFMWIPVFFLNGQDNEICVDCHSDETLEVYRYGVRLSLNVTDEHLEGTPHEGFDCIECHFDMEGIEDFPHPPRLSLPDCGVCHEDAQENYVEGFFEPLQEKGYTSIPNCVDCHGRHKISWKGKPRQVCGVCHQDVLNEFYESAHWDQDAETSDVTCVSCHSPHHKIEKDNYTLSGWKIQITEYCRACHQEQVNNYDLSHHYQQLKRGDTGSPTCSDCHARHKILSPRNPESKVSVARLDQVCTECHKGYIESIHRPDVGDDPRLETCVVCHTGHSTDMLPEVKSVIYDINLAQVCLKCHEKSLITGENDAHGGIHRNQIDRISWGENANCGLCHQYHYRAPGHLITKGIEKSCEDCHQEQQAEYEKSSHYLSRAKGHQEAPGCMDCHGESIIQTPNSKLMGRSVVELCSSCHGNREMTMKFQLSPEVIEGYNTSYHGQMYQLGYQGEEFATCVSCHDNHSILPSTNPQSSVSQQHIIETCGECHENVNINFVSYLQHYTPMTHQENKVLKYIHLFMVWLLGTVFVLFGGHTLLWLIRLLIKRIRYGPIKKEDESGKRVMRFSVLERVQHLGVILSFLTLSATGLPLKYSHTEVANWIANNVFGFRGAAIAHRAAAILLIGIFIFHIGHVLYRWIVKKEKGFFWGDRSLVPNLQDAKDFFSHLAYFIGVNKKPPKFGRWTYWEKFDYLAVFWGMVIIGLSGLMLWFPELFTRIAPGWLINAAHIIHSEEALLATAFIFTIHFFNTHLRPGAFPMDEVMFSGRMTLEQFKEERILEFDSIDEDELKSRLVEPRSKRTRLLMLIAGYLFLSIGFFLLIVIIIGTFL